MHTWYPAACGAVIAGVAAYLLYLLRLLRRAGRRDRAGELVIWTATVFGELYFATLYIPVPQARYVRLALQVAGLAVCFGFAAVRVYRHRHTLRSSKP